MNKSHILMSAILLIAVCGLYSFAHHVGYEDGYEEGRSSAKEEFCSGLSIYGGSYPEYARQFCDG